MNKREYEAALVAKDARIKQLEGLLRRFMDELDGDWSMECGDWPAEQLYTDAWPIGLVRDIDAAMRDK